MSFVKEGKDVPKMGNVFPDSGSYTIAVAVALQHDLGDTHRAIKTLVRWTGASDRAAKNWLSGASGPSGEHLIALVRHSDAVFTAVLRLAGKEQCLLALNAIEAIDKLAGALEALRSFTSRAGVKPVG